MQIMPKPLSDLSSQFKSVSKTKGYTAVVPAEIFLGTVARIAVAAPLAIYLPCAPKTLCLAGAAISVPSLAIATGSRLFYYGTMTAVSAVSAGAISTLAIGLGCAVLGFAFIQNYNKKPYEIIAAFTIYPLVQMLAPATVRLLGSNSNGMSEWDIVDYRKVRSSKKH